MTTRFLTLAGLLASAALLAAEPDPEPPISAKAYRTPQAVFDAMLAARAKKDFKTFVGCLAPEAQKDMAVRFAVDGLRHRAEVEAVLAKRGQDEKLIERYRPMFDALDRHGLTPKAAKGIRLDFADGKKTHEAVLKLVGQPAAFAAAFLAASEKVNPGRMAGDGEVKPRLTDLEVKGDKAVGTVVTPGPNYDKDKTPDRRGTVEFLKVNGGWRIDPEARRRKAE